MLPEIVGETSTLLACRATSKGWVVRSSLSAGGAAPAPAGQSHRHLLDNVSLKAGWQGPALPHSSGMLLLLRVSKIACHFGLVGLAKIV